MISNDNLGQMLIYASRLWGMQKHINLGGQAQTSPLDVVALIVAAQIRAAEKRGLYRSYEAVIESTSRPRGRVLLSETINLRAVGCNEVVVETDELSADNSVNRNIRWAAEFLLQSGTVTADTRVVLKSAIGRLGGVSRVSRPTRALKTDLLQARRPEYRVALSMVSLLSSCMQIQLGAESSTATLGPSLNEILFSQIFEVFVREFYRYHLKSARVSGRRMRWSGAVVPIEPVMLTDITVENDDSILVIDTKYYVSALSKRDDFGVSSQAKLRSINLYQIFTYMSYTSASNPGMPVSGMLMYPENGTSVDHTVDTIQGPIRAKTINLMQDWERVEAELLSFVA